MIKLLYKGKELLFDPKFERANLASSHGEAHRGAGIIKEEENLNFEWLISGADTGFK